MSAGATLAPFPLDSRFAASPDLHSTESDCCAARPEVFSFSDSHPLTTGFTFTRSALLEVLNVRHPPLIVKYPRPAGELGLSTRLSAAAAAPRRVAELSWATPSSILLPASCTCFWSTLPLLPALMLSFRAPSALLHTSPSSLASMASAWNRQDRKPLRNCATGLFVCLFDCLTSS